MQYYFSNGVLTSANYVSEIPTHIQSWWSFENAISYLQRFGAVGWNQHQIRNEDHALAIAVIKHEIETHGKHFPVVYRGVRHGCRPETEHLILYGARCTEVAQWYASQKWEVGEIRTYRNIRGISYRSHLRSVRCEGWWDDDYEGDEEVIFFPEHNQHLWRKT